MKARRAFSKKLPSLQHLFVTQLLIICLVEMLVHFFLHRLIPDSNEIHQAIADALLLSVVTAPFVWTIIARPLRTVAISEFSRAETVLGTIIEAVVCFNAQGRIESLNPAAEKMFASRPDELIGRNVSTIIPDFAVSESADCAKASSPSKEAIALRKDGTALPVLMTISSINPAGPPLFAAMMHDISDQKRAASALEEQREFSLQLVQDLATPCFVLDPDHKVLVWNQACEDLTGIGSVEVVGTDLHWKAFYDVKRLTLADVVLDGVPPALHVEWKKSSYHEHGFQCEGWFHNVGGKERYLHFEAVPVHNGKGEVIAAIETLQDLTERRRVRDSLAKSEEKFHKAFHASPDGIVINSKMEGFFIEANEAFVRMLGYRRDEVIGHTSQELGLWVDPGQRAAIIDRTNRDGAVRNAEVSIRVKSGLIRTFLWSSDVITLHDTECLIVTVRDITEHKENERQLVESKAELTRKNKELSLLCVRVTAVKKEWERTLDCINDVVILLDPEGRVKRCNRAALEFVGVSYGEILGLDWQHILEVTGMSLPPISAVQSFYCREVRLEASNRWLSVTCYPDKADEHDRRETVITVHDITKEKQAALELVEAYTKLKDTHTLMFQQEKMASLGQLAAGVAHEINNPTGFIISNLGALDKYQARLVQFIAAQKQAIDDFASCESQKLATLRKEMKIDHIIGDIPELVSESLDGARRIEKIVQSLKGFSRKDDDKCTVASLTDCLEGTINIIWNQIKYDATLRKEYGEVSPIRCYPQKLSQVFMNLIVNAAHALEGQGEIMLRTWQNGEVAYISVTDTGSGIPEGIRSRIFDPFFTTKEVGKGTGLGLSISREIVRGHGGEMTVESTVGIGTTFTVMLPLNGVQDEYEDAKNGKTV